MVSHWSLSDNKSPHVSRNLLSILNNTFFLSTMVFTRPLISKSSSPCSNPLMIVPRTPITIGSTDTFMFHIFFNSLARSRYFILLFTFFQFYSVINQESKVHNSASSLVFYDYYIIWSSGRG